jgi:hypothetical protein
MCLVAAICFRESLVELCGDGATLAILDEEACIITPRSLSEPAYNEACQSCQTEDAP